MSASISSGLYSTLIVVFCLGASMIWGGESGAPGGESTQPLPDMTAVVHHLQEAADHLKRAGKQELAEQLLAEASRLAKEQTLAEKEEQLISLQQDIRQLQQATGADRQVLLRLKLVECRLDEQLPSVASILAKMDKAAGQDVPDGEGGMCRMFASAQAVDLVLADMRSRRQAKVLAEPVLVTTSGRPASLRVGGEVPPPTPEDGSAGPARFLQHGTSVDVLSTVQPDGSVRLELRLQHSEIDPLRRVTIGEESVPGLRTRALNTALEIKGGQTLVLGGMVQQPESNQESGRQPTVLLLTVTAELVDPLAQVPPAPLQR